MTEWGVLLQGLVVAAASYGATWAAVKHELRAHRRELDDHEDRIRDIEGVPTRRPR